MITEPVTDGTNIWYPILTPIPPIQIAAASDDMRPSLNMVHVTQKLACATDAHILTWTDLSNYFHAELVPLMNESCFTKECWKTLHMMSKEMYKGNWVFVRVENGRLHISNTSYFDKIISFKIYERDPKSHDWISSWNRNVSLPDYSGPVKVNPRLLDRSIKSLGDMDKFSGPTMLYKEKALFVGGMSRMGDAICYGIVMPMNQEGGNVCIEFELIEKKS